jgi:hypothetical protein
MRGHVLRKIFFQSRPALSTGSFGHRENGISMPTIAVVLFAFVYFFLQGYAFQTLKGKWRHAAWAPAAAMVTSLAYDGIVTLLGSGAALIPLQITLILCLLWVAAILLVNLRDRPDAAAVMMQEHDDAARRQEILGRL